MPLRENLHKTHSGLERAFMADPEISWKAFHVDEVREKLQRMTKKFRLWRKVIKHYARVNRDEEAERKEIKHSRTFPSVFKLRVRFMTEGNEKLFLLRIRFFRKLKLLA